MNFSFNKGTLILEKNIEFFLNNKVESESANFWFKDKENQIQSDSLIVTLMVANTDEAFNPKVFFGFLFFIIIFFLALMIYGSIKQ